MEFTKQRGNNGKKSKSNLFYFGPTPLLDHAASRLVKKPKCQFCYHLRAIRHALKDLLVLKSFYFFCNQKECLSVNVFFSLNLNATFLWRP